jgi:hypothetical protein
VLGSDTDLPGLSDLLDEERHVRLRPRRARGLLQRLGQLAGRAPGLGARGEHAGDQGAQHLAAAGVEGACGRGRGLSVGRGAEGEVWREGVLVGDEAEGGDAQGEDIIGRPGRGGDEGQGKRRLKGAPGLGRAVVGSAGRKGVRGEGRGAEEVAGAEVGEEDVAVGEAEEGVVAFDVAVEAACGVGGFQGASEAGEDVEDLT